MQKLIPALFGLSLFLAACGQNTPPAVQASPTAPTDAYAADYAKGAPAPWSYTAPQGVTFNPADASSWSAVGSAKNGWGPIEVNQSVGERDRNDGHAIKLGEQVYASGLGLHAYAELSYEGPFAFGGTALACTLEADVGVDAEVGNRGSVVFEGWADGVKVYDTGILRGGEAGRHIKWNIPAAKSLKLVVTDAGDGINYDHADLADPVIACKLASTPVMTLSTDQLDIYHLHNNKLQATFRNFPAGVVGLSLELAAGETYADPPGYFSDNTPGPLFVADTSVVSLSGPASEVHTIQISAPRKLSDVAPSLRYRLVATVNGREIASAPVVLKELPIKLTAIFDSAPVVRSGDTATIGLTVTADPPLDRARQLNLLEFRYNNSYSAKIVSVGPVTGDGYMMKAMVTIKFQAYVESEYGLNGHIYGVAIDGVTNGYRDSLYYNQPNAFLSFTIVP